MGAMAARFRLDQDPARVTVVSCPDGEAVQNVRRADKFVSRYQMACTCKTIRWFVHALATWPAAGHFGKLEEDTMLYVPRLLTELRLIHAVEQRATGSDAPLIWYAHFGWAFHGHECSATGQPILANRHCGPGDHWMLARRALCKMPSRRMPRKVSCGPIGTLSLFPFGSLDIRSRALAQLTFRECDDAIWLVDEYNWTEGSFPGHCDGILGNAVVGCLARRGSSAGDGRAPNVPVAAWHLTRRKHMEYGVPPRQHTVVVHDRVKIATGGMKQTYPEWAQVPPPQEWEAGPALLPIRFTLG
jgi:hypothetical protein